METHNILDRIGNAYSYQPTYLQTVTEFLESALPYLHESGATEDVYARLERLLVPERVISFKVVWEDDAGMLQYNIGYRVQYNAALGPFKGGLRFDPSVNEDILKFLGFEQIFKNALTGLPLGGGKGGSNFDPKGKSDNEIRRFCTAFMMELVRHIGPYTDVPAGDIGVGSREIGYLYGAYKRLSNKADGALTGKGVIYNGSHIRTEATGYGAVYFIKQVLERRSETIAGKRVAISGSGNVALHVAEKMLHEGAVVLSLSDRKGYVYAKDGMNNDFIETVKQAKANGEALCDTELPKGTIYAEGQLWPEVPADICIPCATQNEFDESDAQAVITYGTILVAEGANMPLTLPAAHAIQEAGVTFVPSKAVNAGGVAVSGLEMSQNASHVSWTHEEVDASLQKIMHKIHDTCVQYGAREDGSIDYVQGANIGGFVRVLRAMRELGW